MFTTAALGVDEKDPVVEVLVRGVVVLLEVVAPLEEVGVHLVPGDEMVLVPVGEEPAVLAALQSSVVGVHVTGLVKRNEVFFGPDLTLLEMGMSDDA